MMMVGYALTHPSGTYEFYNPNTDSIIISNSVKWSVFNRWEATNVDSMSGKLYDIKSDSQKEDLAYSDSGDDFENDDYIVPPNASKVRFSNMSTPPPSSPGVTTHSMSKTRPPTPPKQQSNLKITLKKVYIT